MKPLTTQTQIGVREPTVDSFVALVKAGIELWAQAGEILVKLVATNPNVYSEIIANNESITFEMLLAFEKMGRRQIYPPLLMDTSPGAKRLLGLPYEVQERFCKEPVILVLPDTNGEIKTTKKYVKELTAYEANQVFDDVGQREPEGQKAYIQNHKAQGRPKKVKEDEELGTFCLKLTPSGGLVAEKVSGKIATTIKVYLKEGTSQCVVRLIK